MKKRMVYNLISSLVYTFAVLIVWMVAAVLVNNSYVVPPINEVLSSMLKIFYVEEFFTAYFSTLSHAMLGFVASFTIGFALAVLGAVNKKARYVFAPMVSSIRLVPTMAIALILCLWVDESVAPAIVAFIVVMPTVYSSALAIFDGVDKDLLVMAKAYGVSKVKTARQIIVPSCQDGIASCLASTFSLTLKLTVGAEVLVGALQSMGGLMYYAKNVYLDPSLVFAVTFWIVITGIIGQFALYSLRKIVKTPKPSVDFTNEKTKHGKEIVLNGLIVKYDDNVVLDNLNLQINAGQKVAIMGKSGCGKTTLLKAISNLINYDGQINSKNDYAFVFQTDRLIPFLSSMQNLAFVKSVDGSEILTAMGLGEEKNKQVKYLSGGMARRVALSRALHKNASCILADEPFTGLDVSTKHSILTALKPLIKDKTFLLVTHDLYSAYELCDTIVVLDDKKIIKIIDSSEQSREKTEKFLENL